MVGLYVMKAEYQQRKEDGEKKKEMEIRNWVKGKGSWMLDAKDQTLGACTYCILYICMYI